jgi:hypothetical protein
MYVHETKLCFYIELCLNCVCDNPRTKDIISLSNCSQTTLKVLQNNTKHVDATRLKNQGFL